MGRGPGTTEDEAGVAWTDGVGRESSVGTGTLDTGTEGAGAAGTEMEEGKGSNGGSGDKQRIIVGVGETVRSGKEVVSGEVPKSQCAGRAGG